MYPSLGFAERIYTIRDPVHGDILLSPIERAIIDTRVFQRLRYIRQNGLLHFVFPGAVHTRFAHSLGTMHVAGCVARSLFEPLSAEPDKVEYLTLAMRAAALLHDVGHCGFSHSVEHVVTENGEPLLKRTRALCGSWITDHSENGFLEQVGGAGEQELQEFLAELLAASPEGTDEAPTSHEYIGLLLSFAVFGSTAVRERCSRVGVKPHDLARDVRALIHGGLSCSSSFEEASVAIAEALGAAECDTPTEDLLRVLHGLISGTLDVDRLDYLNRDSLHCGVTYGRCQADFLIKSLELAAIGDEIKLVLDRKAAHALDDMLWSRYQLFLQVLNHKTNVGLNATLGQALLEAKRDGRIDLPGERFSQFISFTDSYVYGKLFELAQNAPAAGGRSFIRVLVDRRVPEWIKEERLPADASSAREREQELVAKFQEEHGVGNVLAMRAESALVKAAALPLLRGRDPNAPATRFEDVSSVVGSAKELPLVPVGHYRVLHFFKQRSGD